MRVAQWNENNYPLTVFCVAVASLRCEPWRN